MSELRTDSLKACAPVYRYGCVCMCVYIYIYIYICQHTKENEILHPVVATLNSMLYAFGSHVAVGMIILRFATFCNILFFVA